MASINSIHNEEDEDIRKIEDIIDLKKASGHFNDRQVAFNVPSECEDIGSTNITKSLESGLSETVHRLRSSKKLNKVRSKRHTSPLPDVISWPSDSDITVLRMKLCLNENDLNKKIGNTVLGDGLHVTDSSSMINLATLMLKSQSPSKHNLNTDEYLLPLTSWENTLNRNDKETGRLETAEPDGYKPEIESPETECDENLFKPLNVLHNMDRFRNDTKSKWARFLRLYFCPCCTCLYKMEGLSEDPSIYFDTNIQRN